MVFQSQHTIASPFLIKKVNWILIHLAVVDCFLIELGMKSLKLKKNKLREWRRAVGLVISPDYYPITCGYNLFFFFQIVLL